MSGPLERISSLSPSMRIVVLHGTESFLITEGTRRLARLLRDEYGDLDQFSFDGEDAELSEVLDELRTYALLKRHKLVIVDNADKFLAGEGRRRALEAYAAEPTPQATLLMRAGTWRPGKFDKLVAQVGAVIKCDAPRDADAVRWCVGHCEQRHGRKIDRAAAELLVERLGPGLARLDSELAKLVSFIGSGTAITRDHVLTLVGRSRQEQAWELQSAIISGRPDAAVVKVRQLLEISRHDPVLVMWAISDLLRRLHTVAWLHRQGSGVQRYRKPLRLFGPDGERMIDVARSAEPRRIAQLLQMAVRTDQRSKSGFGDPSRNVEALTLLVTDTIRCI